MDSKHSRSKPRMKKKQSGRGVVDRISQLPDDIILTILSLLSSMEAAATSVLSSRWSSLWKQNPNLNFINTYTPHKLNYKTTEIEHTSWDVDTCKYVKMVNSALQSHQALSLKQFKIFFYVNKSGKSAVAKWLEFVWSRQVESLELSFQCLKVKHMVVVEELLGEMRPMNHLKRLCLVAMKVSGEAISLFLRNCPLLRELIVRSSTLTSDVDVCGETLMLDLLDIHESLIRKSVNISAPNLTRVKVNATPGKLFFENVPKLVTAWIIFKSPTYGLQHFASATSCIFSQLQKLTITLFYPKELLANVFPQMPNLKELVVRDQGMYEHGCLLPLKALISASPHLQKFTLGFDSQVKDATSQMEQVIRNAKLFKFQGCCASDIIQLLKYISDSNCAALQKINTCSPLMGKAELRAHRHHIKQKLQAELPHGIQLRFFN